MRQRGLLCILAAASLFGLGSVLAKMLGEAFNPFFVSWLSLTGGSICVAAFQIIRHRPLIPRLTRASWIDLLLLAGPGTALPLVCVVVGLSQTSAITGSFLLQLQGPAAILCAIILLKEKIVWKQVAGIAVLLVGSLLVILRDPHGPIQITGGRGDLFVTIAALGLGFSYIAGKRLVDSGDAWQIILLRLVIGSCLLLPFLFFSSPVLLTPFAWSLVGILVLYIVTNFGMAYIFQQIGLGLLPAWQSAATMQTLPLFSTVFALLLLHESLTSLQMIGGCVILLGGLLVI